MNCEAVEELLSAYLDNALASKDRNAVAEHVQTCSHCSSTLADFRRFDALLAQLPRVSPEPALKERIFSSPEYLELTGTFDRSGGVERQTAPQKSLQTEIPSRPKLVAIPGGRSPKTSRSNTTTSHMPAPRTDRRFAKRHVAWGQRIMQIVAVAALLLTISIGSVIGWKLWLGQAKTATNAGAITPPADLQTGPLPAGTRFVFLRDGALWSGSADSAMQIVRLTPANVTVAMDWTIRPPLAGRPVGDMIAYIDLQQGLIHTIRNDGQSDTVIHQPLLKAGVQPSSVWDTELGSDILSSLTWSKDGSMLAFVADPKGTGLPQLYICSMATGEAHMVTLPMSGEAAMPVWSPDSIRIAFEYMHGGNVGIIDYNTQNHGLLTIADAVNTPQYPSDTVLTLAWSPNTDAPTVTWSVGTAGHIHSVWSRHIGTSTARMLTAGNYAQAVYSQAGHAGIGSWLLILSQANSAGDLLRLDLNASIVRLSSNKQVSHVQWSPDGTYIDYLDALSSGVGTLHQFNSVTGIDTLVATGVTKDPAPLWFNDSQHLVYSTSTHIFVFSKQGATQQLKLAGPAFTFASSPASPQQLIVAVGDGQQGIYMVDTGHNTSVQLDKATTRGPIEWTQIP